MRILPLVAAALLSATGATAVLAASDSPVQVYRFVSDGPQDSLTTVKIGTIIAEAPGVIEVYDYRSGTQGELLASRAFEAGTTPSARVNLGFPRRNDVLTVIKVGGEVVRERVVAYSGN